MLPAIKIILLLASIHMCHSYGGYGGREPFEAEEKEEILAEGDGIVSGHDENPYRSQGRPKRDKYNLDDEEDSLNLDGEGGLGALNSNKKEANETTPPRPLFQKIPPIKSFHGRGELLARLHTSIQKSKRLQNESLESPDPTPQPHHQAVKFIKGGSATGKTELVRKYVEKYGHLFDRVIWLDGVTGEASLLSAFAGTFHALKTNTSILLNDTSGLKLGQSIRDAIYGNVSQGWSLIIFDEVPPNSKNNYLHLLPPLYKPPLIQPIIIVTAHNLDSDWMIRYEEVDVFQVENFDENENVGFVLPHISTHDYEYDRGVKIRLDIVEVSELLQGSPLALQMAYSYMKETWTGIQTYIQLYKAMDREQRLGNVNINSTSGGQSQNLPALGDPISIAWFINKNEFDDTDEGNNAIEIMDTMATLQCEIIPPELLFALTPLEAYPEQDRAGIFEKGVELLEKFGSIEKIKVDDEEMIQCQKHVVKAVRDHLKWEKRESLKKTILASAMELVEGILKDEREKPGLNYTSWTKSLKIFGGKSEPVGKDLGVLALKIKVALVHEKMGDWVTVRIWSKNFMTALREMKMEAEELGKIFDDLYKFQEKAKEGQMSKVMDMVEVIDSFTQKLYEDAKVAFGESDSLTVLLMGRHNAGEKMRMQKIEL